jgi:hypothetical protein
MPGRQRQVTAAAFPSLLGVVLWVTAATLKLPVDLGRRHQVAAFSS